MRDQMLSSKSTTFTNISNKMSLILWYEIVEFWKIKAEG